MEITVEKISEPTIIEIDEVRFLLIPKSDIGRAGDITLSRIFDYVMYTEELNERNYKLVKTAVRNPEKLIKL